MKFKQSVKITKTGKCCVALCFNTRTELHHIFGRDAILVDDPWNIVEICVCHHINKSSPEVFRAICEIQIKKYGEGWIGFAFIAARKMAKHKETAMLIKLAEERGVLLEY